MNALAKPPPGLSALQVSVPGRIADADDNLPTSALRSIFVRNHCHG